MALVTAHLRDALAVAVIENVGHLLGELQPPGLPAVEELPRRLHLGGKGRGRRGKDGALIGGRRKSDTSTEKNEEIRQTILVT